jgi:redox-sensitive bicupin YhaK (pirin superfamily)
MTAIIDAGSELSPLGRKVISLTSSVPGLEGEGFPVKRAFAGVDLALLDPFVHLDEMGEVDYGPGEPKGTPWHPHRGFETVTYMLEGSFVHRDSIGGGGSLEPGDTQWMTAGAGILHIERPPEELVVTGGLFHGLQLWVNLPSRKKFVPPRYQDIKGNRVTKATTAVKDATIRVIAGSIGDVTGPGVTHTPITMLHVSLDPAARLSLPWPQSYNCLVYAMSGQVLLTQERTLLKAGMLAVLADGSRVDVMNDYPQSAELIILGGEPIGEPVAWYGPFVMNTRAELNQAFEDYRSGRLGTIPAEHI